MTNRPPAVEWQRTEAALDTLLALPPSERLAAVARIRDADPGLAAELNSLVGLLEGPGGVLDEAAAAMLQGAGSVPSELTPGTRLGPWMIVARIGRGGMGEVFRAQRADGQFEQRVAIKLLHLDGEAYLARFRAERQIVASLDHPCIARLIGGDVTAQGRPYMVMELVEGRSIVEWCEQHHASLERRLALFIDICGAVAYAHRNLVVHRDLKPSNVLVTADGRPKLLDFGIARLLDVPAGEPTRELALTPGYAPPEQLAGGRVTTAADIYSLGVLLYELLCGRPAFDVQNLPLAAAIQSVLTRPPVPPSRAARANPAAPVQAALLTGDLDAIVAKAIRTEPDQRYGSVDALRDDVQRHLSNLPVRARRGNWSYVSGRALRRHKAWFGVGALAVLVLVGATTVVAWQAHLARDEAARATAVKDFLLHVFKASDPRIASNQPRGLTTARELLDAGASQIDRDFHAQPALQLELLGMVSTLYRELGEPERYLALQKRRLALAQAYPGRFTTDEVEVLLNLVGDDDAVGNLVVAHGRLAQADALLRQSGLDKSLLRAQWWLAQGQSLDPGDIPARRAAFTQALALFMRFGPHSPGRVTTLSEVGLTYYDLQDNATALRWYQEALTAEQTTVDRDDGEMQTILGNIGNAYLNLGRYEEAAAALRQAAELADLTYGERHSDYWFPASNYARLLHLNGRRDEAMSLFGKLRGLMPFPPTTRDGREVLATYVDCLIAEGDAEHARPLGEALLQTFLSTPQSENSVRRMRLRLGDAYEQLGRFADARSHLNAAYEEFVRTETPERQTRMAATERWARFLVAHGDAATAQTLFTQVLAQDQGRHLSHAVLARAGLARVALLQGNVASAEVLSRTALAEWGAVRGFRDVRMAPYMQRIRARVLLASGDTVQARFIAQAALEQSLKFDSPGADSIREARALLGQGQDPLSQPAVYRPSRPTSLEAN